MGAATFGILRYFNTVLYYQHSTVHSGVVLKMITYCNNILYLNLFKKFIPTIPVYTCIYCIINYKQGSVVRRPDSTIHWIVIFSTFVKLTVDQYNLRLIFGIYKLKFLRSIVGSDSQFHSSSASLVKVALFAIQWIAYPVFVQPAPGKYSIFQTCQSIRYKRPTHFF